MTNYLIDTVIRDTYKCEDGSTIVVEAKKQTCGAVANVCRYASDGTIIGNVELTDGYHGCKYTARHLVGMAYEATSMLWELARFAGTALTTEDDELADKRAATYMEACELQERASALLSRLR